MKISIRNGVFETNSSSEHAIVIDTSGNVEKYALSFYDGPELGEFGRQTKLLTDTEARLSYLWTAIWDLKNSYAGQDSSKWNDFYKEVIDRTNNLPDLDWWKDRIHSICVELDKYSDEDFRCYELPNYMDNKYSFDATKIYGDKKINKFLRHFEDYKSYERHYWTHEWSYVGVDHVNAIIPFLELMAKDDKLFRDYVAGEGSYVLVTNNEGGFSKDVPKLADADLIFEAFNSDELCDWNKVHDFPESNRVIFIKGD